MAKFNLVRADILEADGCEREYEIIVDLSKTGRVVLSELGIDTQTARGFIRSRGRHYLGVVGRHTTVLGGHPDDVYYDAVSLFDGRWSHSGSSVTKWSGTGRLYSELERFAEANSLAAS